MAATYDVSDLDDSTAAGRKNIVRLLLNDNTVSAGTTVANPEFDDDEIAYFLTEHGDAVYPAAIAAARTAVAKYATASSSRRIGDLSISSGSRAQEWRGVLASLKQAMLTVDGMNAISNADLTNQFEPSFTIGMHDNPRVANDEATS